MICEASLTWLWWTSRATLGTSSSLISLCLLRGVCLMSRVCPVVCLVPAGNKGCISVFSYVIWFCFFVLLTGPPSPPRNIMFNLNDTCLMLEWSPPSDTGGRRDLTYNVQCKRCGPDPDQCQLCEEELRFLPRPLGLTNATVTVMDFSAHANYTFEIESLNGVSDMSSFPRQVAIVIVSTDQGGEY